MGNQCSPHHSLQALYIVRVRKGASNEEIEALLHSTSRYSDDTDWNQALEEARVIETKREKDSKRELESKLELQQILKLRKDLDKQGSFSTNLLSYLNVRQELISRKESGETDSVATSCSSIQDERVSEE